MNRQSVLGASSSFGLIAISFNGQINRHVRRPADLADSVRECLGAARNRHVGRLVKCVATTALPYLGERRFQLFRDTTGMNTA